MLLVILAMILAKTDATQWAAISSVVLAAAALVRSITIDPRASRMAERKENAELRTELDNLYREKRAAEDRERDALRRIDRQERDLDDQKTKLERAEKRISSLRGELDGAQAQIRSLEGEVRTWKAIAGDIRRER